MGLLQHEGKDNETSPSSDRAEYFEYPGHPMSTAGAHCLILVNGGKCRCGIVQAIPCLAVYEFNRHGRHNRFLVKYKIMQNVGGADGAMLSFVTERRALHHSFYLSVVHQVCPPLRLDMMPSACRQGWRFSSAYLCGTRCHGLYKRPRCTAQCVWKTVRMGKSIFTSIPTQPCRILIIEPVVLQPDFTQEVRCLLPSNGIMSPLMWSCAQWPTLSNFIVWTAALCLEKRAVPKEAIMTSANTELNFRLGDSQQSHCCVNGQGMPCLQICLTYIAVKDGKFVAEKLFRMEDKIQN